MEKPAQCCYIFLLFKKPKSDFYEKASDFKLLATISKLNKNKTTVLEKQNTSVSHIQLWVAGLQSALVNSIRTFQFTPKNLCPQFTPLLWIWIIRCLYGISIWRSHQSQSEMWFKPTRKLFIPLVFSISGNNSTIHLVRQDRTLGVSLHTYFSLSPLVPYQSSNPINYAS